MAFFEVVTSIFSISTLLSLMMRKRAAPDEAGPSRPRRPTRRVDAEKNANVEQEWRSKRDLDPRILLERSLLPNIGLGKFRNRRVVFEAHVDEKMLGTYPVIEFLTENGWGPIFEGKAPARSDNIEEKSDEIEESKGEKQSSEDEEGSGEDGDGDDDSGDKEGQQEEEVEAQGPDVASPPATHEHDSDRATSEAR
ncbi:uncharacterized protein LOC131244136 [Magnolia sinica]|uniref:uncharacterized protein LOC131244136 n=1 Tax=Magnolia sinica TaxID=86752 RepID=UPI002659C2CF|nr:uncharacterized protein LOC131244136 [Magnolia sinica]